jgi:DNA repair ATPase RecN
MTNEEIQRTMEFILEQQAQFAVNVQRLQEEHLRDGPRLDRLEESFQLLVQLAQNTDSRLDRVEANLDRVEINLERITTNMEKVQASIAALVDAQDHTDERLSALIDIVREGRNGKS